MQKWTPPWILILILMGFLLTLTACTFTSALREPTPTPVPTAQVRVTPAQLAQSMQDDQFFAQYKADWLIVSGQVATVNQTTGDLQISFATGLPTNVVCDLGNQTASIRTGDTVTIQAAGSNAERGQSAVILRKCSLKQ